MRTLLAALLVGTTGCAASVNAEALDGGFGLGLSALLIQGDDNTGGVMVTNVADACTVYQDVSDSLTEYLELISKAFAGEEITCADLEEPLTSYVNASEALYKDGNSFLTVGSNTKLDVDEFSIPDDASGSLSKVTDDFDGSYLDDFDPDGDIMENCGMGEDSGESPDGDAWVLSDGTFTVTAFSDEESLSGSLDATLEDEKGKEDGDITASFSATYCELD